MWLQNTSQRMRIWLQRLPSPENSLKLRVSFARRWLSSPMQRNYTSSWVTRSALREI